MRHAASGLFAGLHATPTGLGANAAMFVHAGVPLAFFAAEATRGAAGVEHAPDDFFVRSGTPCRNTPGDVADVGAVQVHAYALCQVTNLGLRKAGIRTGRACLGTRVAFLDTTDQCVIGAPMHVRVGADHLLGLHGHSPERERWSSMQQSTEGSNMRPNNSHGGNGRSKIKSASTDNSVSHHLASGEGSFIRLPPRRSELQEILHPAMAPRRQ
jgi:hypothetical protein